jgi:hypothetical protein
MGDEKKNKDSKMEAKSCSDTIRAERCDQLSPGSGAKIVTFLNVTYISSYLCLSAK